MTKAIFGDWQLNGVFGAFSGTPFTVTADGTRYNTPGTSQTADLVGEFETSGIIGAQGQYFERSLFAQPTGVRQGDTGRNQFRGPGGWNLDFSVFRVFPVGGQRRLELRVEADNILNHPVFGNPSSGITSGTFGQVTGLGANSYIERQIQVGIRFQF